MPTYTKKMDVEFEYRVQYPDKTLGEVEPAVMVWVSSIGGVLVGNIPQWLEIDEALTDTVQHEIEEYVSQGGV